jgi:methionyl aminopeptidase
MITIKTEEQIEIMRQGGKILAKIMEELEKEVRPGVSTEALDKAASDLVFKYGAEPSFKGYDNFPAVLCTSVNEEVVHVPPSGRVLEEGDIVVLDLGIKYKGFHTDTAATIVAGKKVNPEFLRLIKATKKALKRGIKKAREGNTFGDIGNTVQRHIESQGFNVVKDLCGHGIGKELHEDPQILNYGKRKTGPTIKKGMVFCIEPITAMGSGIVEKMKNNGYKTKDNSMSAHFEHTIAITDKGTEILTEL